jgi:flagellar assembly protein FliH
MAPRDPFAPKDPLFQAVSAPRRLPLSALATRRVKANGVFPADFDAPRRPVPEPVPEPAPEPEVIVPSFSAAELEEARRAAFREGQEAGRLAAAKEADAAGAAALATLARDLAPATEAARALQEQAAESVTRLLLGALVALHPSLSRQLAEADLAAMAEALLPALAEQPRLTIHLAPAQAAALRPRLTEMAAHAHFNGRLEVREDATLAEAAALFSWSTGAASRDPDRAREALVAALDAVGLSPTLPTQASQVPHVMEAAQ